MSMDKAGMWTHHHVCCRRALTHPPGAHADPGCPQTLAALTAVFIFTLSAEMPETASSVLCPERSIIARFQAVLISPFPLSLSVAPLSWSSLKGLRFAYEVWSQKILHGYERDYWYLTAWRQSWVWFRQVNRLQICCQLQSWKRFAVSSLS